MTTPRDILERREREFAAATSEWEVATLQQKWLAEDEARAAAPAAAQTPRPGISRQKAQAMAKALAAAVGDALGQTLAERDGRIEALERRVAAAELDTLNLRMRLGERWSARRPTAKLPGSAIGRGSLRWGKRHA